MGKSHRDDETEDNTSGNAGRDVTVDGMTQAGTVRKSILKNLSVRPKPVPIKTVFLMRHSERVDRIFPMWMSLGFTIPETDDIGAVAEGKKVMKKWVPWDLNLPIILPKRLTAHTQFKDDTPITELGGLVAQMIGRGFLIAGQEITTIYTSPALRCVQTASKVLRAMKGSPVKPLRVEPGLFEWLGAYPTLPAFLTPVHLALHGFPVFTDYTPITNLEALTKLHAKGETKVEGAERQAALVKKLAGDLKDGEQILVVSHALTLDAGARGLRGKPAKGWDDSDDLGSHYPYSCLLSLREEKGNWALVNVLPPVTHLEVDTRINLSGIRRP